jgi:hypothetical protein
MRATRRFEDLNRASASSKQRAQADEQPGSSGTRPANALSIQAFTAFSPKIEPHSNAVTDSAKLGVSFVYVTGVDPVGRRAIRNATDDPKHRGIDGNKDRAQVRLFCLDEFLDVSVCLVVGKFLVVKVKYLVADLPTPFFATEPT